MPDHDLQLLLLAAIFLCGQIARTIDKTFFPAALQGNEENVRATPWAKLLLFVAYNEQKLIFLTTLINMCVSLH